MASVSPEGEIFELLSKKIQDKSAVVAVAGVGYVGLPLAVGFGRAGFHVLAIDLDSSKIDALSRGESYIADVTPAEVKELLDGQRLHPTSDLTKLFQADLIHICVPTPLRKTKEPDISFILAAAESIKRYLRRGQAIVLESTTYPGTTDEVLLPLFESTGLKIDRDFFLAFSPERVDPGNARFDTHNIPKVVGGVTPASTSVVSLAYRQWIAAIHQVSSARVAETCKLLENTFRSVNIGLANEFARMCRALGIDTWEVIGAAATKPFGFMPFYPGPGLGGHCIPLDPHYLSWKARLHGYESRFIGLAEEINSSMPDFVVQMVVGALNSVKKPVNDSRIVILGVSYKRDIEDVRESPAGVIIGKLIAQGAAVSYSDPLVPEMKLDGLMLRHTDLTPEMLRASDCAVIVTDHSNIDYRMVVESAPLVVDTRNATRALGDNLPNVFRL